MSQQGDVISIHNFRSVFQKSKQAQKTWSALPLKERQTYVQNFAKCLQDNKLECSKILSEEMGKPVRQALREVEATCERIEWFLTHTECELKTEVPYEDKSITEKISWEPLGVVLNISAWNYPYFVGSNVFIPALLTGNSVIYKSSEITPRSGEKVAEFFNKIGLPQGVFQHVQGDGNVGAQLVELPVDGVFFTGSKSTGAKIAAACAQRFIKTTLELGGKDAAYVCEDVTVKQAAESLADGAFYNAGQSCCAIERIYVHEKVYDEFVQHFVSFTKTLQMGDPSHDQTYFGPLARSQHVSFLEDQVQDALMRGATLTLSGGKVVGRTVDGKEAAFFKPVVLTQVNHTMKVMREESFGPVIGIAKVSHDEEALELFNDSDYGLTGTIYTKNEQRALAFLQKVDTGTVYWNCCDRVSSYIPWSGRRGSGLGSTLSHIGVKTFLKPKAWHLRELH